MSFYNNPFENDEQRRQREAREQMRRQQGMQVSPQGGSFGASGERIQSQQNGFGTQPSQANQNFGTMSSAPNAMSGANNPNYHQMSTREELDDRFRRGGFFKEEYEREAAQNRAQSLQNNARTQLGMGQTIDMPKNTIVDNQQEYEDRYKNPLLTGLKNMNTQDWKSVGGDMIKAVTSPSLSSSNLLSQSLYKYNDKIEDAMEGVYRASFGEDGYNKARGVINGAVYGVGDTITGKNDGTFSGGFRRGYDQAYQQAKQDYENAMSRNPQATKFGYNSVDVLNKINLIKNGVSTASNIKGQYKELEDLYKLLRMF